MGNFIKNNTSYPQVSVPKTSTLFIIPLLATMLMIFVTHEHKMGVTVDSMRYMSMAKHIASGKGVQMYNRTTGGESKPVINHPPLLPVILAIPAFLDIPFETSTWILMNFLLLANIFLTGFLACLLTRRIIFSFLAQILFVLDQHLMGYHAYVLTEPLFFFQILLCLILLTYYLRTYRTHWLFWIALMIGLAALNRYPGIVLVAAFGLTIFFFGSGHLISRLGKSIIFGLMASALPAIWFIRHRIITGENFDRVIGGVQPETGFHPWTMLRSVLENFIQYPLAPDGSEYLAFFWIVPLCVFAACDIAYFRFWRKSGLTQRLRGPIVLNIFLLTYVTGIFALWTWRSEETLADPVRFMTPAYLIFWIFLTIALFLATYSGTFGTGAKTVLGVLGLLWLLFLSGGLYDWALTGMMEGTYGRNDQLSWQFVNRLRWFP